MNPVDIVMLSVVLLSSFLGVWRGLTRELVSTVAWVLIAVLVVRFSEPLGAHLGLDAPPWVRMVAAGAIIVVICVLISALLSRFLHAAVSASPLAGADRVLGGVFGALRAAMLGLVLAAVVVESGFSEQKFWRQSVSGPLLENGWHTLAGTSPGTHPSWWKRLGV